MRRIKREKDLPEQKNANTYRQTSYAYRISLVRDKHVRFLSEPVTEPGIGARVIRNTIKKAGQTDRENVVVIMLSSNNEITGTNIVSQGTLNRSFLTMREIFKPAIIANAAAIVMGHNHPSGDCSPSKEDRLITKKTREAGRLLGIELLDHIIVGRNGKYFSFKENGLTD
ncbi:MAG: JAB domain-containing protein [Pseudomonadota bacterium]